MPSTLCLVLRAKSRSGVFEMIARCGIKATVGSDALTKHPMSIRRRSTPTNSSQQVAILLFEDVS